MVNIEEYLKMEFTKDELIAMSDAKQLIDEARDFQIEKWGGEGGQIWRFANWHEYVYHKIVYTTEELGEVSRSAQERDIENTIHELSQTAALCQATIEGLLIYLAQQERNRQDSFGG